MSNNNSDRFNNVIPEDLDSFGGFEDIGDSFLDDIDRWKEISKIDFSKFENNAVRKATERHVSEEKEKIINRFAEFGKKTLECYGKRGLELFLGLLFAFGIIIGAHEIIKNRSDVEGVSETEPSASSYDDSFDNELTTVNGDFDDDFMLGYIENDYVITHASNGIEAIDDKSSPSVEQIKFVHNNGIEKSSDTIDKNETEDIEPEPELSEVPKAHELTEHFRWLEKYNKLKVIGNNNEEKLWNILKLVGFSDVQTAALMGNAKEECPNFNPFQSEIAAPGIAGNGRSIWQFDYFRPEWESVMKKHGFDPSLQLCNLFFNADGSIGIPESLDGETISEGLVIAVETLTCHMIAGDYEAKLFDNCFDSSTTPGVGAINFCKILERPARYDAKKRSAFAEEMYGKYAGKING